MATRKQKEQLRKRRHLEQKKLRGLGEPRPIRLRKNAKPWLPVKMKMFNMPQLFPSGMTWEQRLEVVRSIGIKSKKEFDEKYPTIEKWFKDFDALYLLSFCGVYFVAQPEGIDPEAHGKLDFPHHFIEIMQAFALYQDRNLEPVPLLNKAEELHKEMGTIGELMMARLLSIPDEAKTEEDVHAFRLRTEMMGNTTAVRNWAFFHQMKRVTFDMADLIDSDFKKIYGIGAKTLVEVIFKLIEERSDLLNDHIDKIRSFYKLRKGNHKDLARAYNVAFPENVPITDEDVEQIWLRANKDMEQLVGMLICHADLKLSNIYSFSIDHAKSFLKDIADEKGLEAALKKLSFKFGDLKDYPMEHIILNNPVLRKPFIDIGEGKYFSAVWGVLPHFVLEILEDFVWANESLRNTYTSHKAVYLEREVKNIFTKAFPNASIHTGSLWKESPSSSVQYENDLIVIIDKFAIIVEAKSQRVDDPAKRGAPARLFETLKELIEEPSTQGLRFINFLKNNKKAHSFSNKAGQLNVIDSSNIKYYIPIGITFSNLGMISGNLKKLIEAKVIEKPMSELAPSISFTDIEIIFEILDSEAQRIHYLSRRREIEAHLEYQGDELDLLGFYLDNGFNIGEVEYSDDHAFNIALKSKELEPYIDAKYEGRNIEKPSLAMTEWWRDLLNRIAERKNDGWIETSFILLNSTKEDQQKFEHGLNKLKPKVLRGKVLKPHNWVVFLSGPERRRYVIVGYPYITEDKEMRNTIMDEIIHHDSTKNTRGVIVIGINMKRNDYPYSVLARKLDTDLFDKLNL